METRGQLRVDPPTLSSSGGTEDLEVVVPYTEWAVTAAVLKRAVVLLAGLNPKLKLVAIHTVPYPADFQCQHAVHLHLVQQLTALASELPFAVQLQVVLARSREDGFAHTLSAHSTVLLGSRKHWWRTAEESLARNLARLGHQVALIHIP